MNVHKGKRIWDYYEICSFLDEGATGKWYASQEVPCAFKNSEWVGYDNVKIFQMRAQCLKESNSGGAMVCSLNMMTSLVLFVTRANLTSTSPCP